MVSCCLWAAKMLSMVGGKGEMGDIDGRSGCHIKCCGSAVAPPGSMGGPEQRISMGAASFGVCAWQAMPASSAQAWRAHQGDENAPQQQGVTPHEVHPLPLHVTFVQQGCCPLPCHTWKPGHPQTRTVVTTAHDNLRLTPHPTAARDAGGCQLVGPLLAAVPAISAMQSCDPMSDAGMSTVAET